MHKAAFFAKSRQQRVLILESPECLGGAKLKDVRGLK